MELKEKKARFITLFYTLVVCNAALRGLQTAELEVAGGLFALVCLGLALYFLYTLFTFSTMLGNGGGKSVAYLIGVLIPLVNLFVIYTMVQQYKAKTGVKTNFFLIDLPEPAT